MGPNGTGWWKLGGNLELVKGVADAIEIYRAEPRSPEIAARLDKAEGLLREAASPRGNFAAMVRAMLRRGITKLTSS